MKYLRKYESPDTVKYDGVLLNHISKDAVPFGFINNEIFVGHKGEQNIHTELADNKTNVISIIPFSHSNRGREIMEYSGRIWVDKKIISFWDYPDNYKELKKILNQIETKYNNDHLKPINIDDNWMIEVIFNGDEQVINKYKYWGVSKIGGDERYMDDSRIIKIGDYKGSGKRSEEEKAKKHTEIGSGGKAKGFG